MATISGHNYIPINKRVRQRYISSLLLFNIYSGLIFQEASQTIEGGIKVNAQIINNIGHADDTTIPANDMEGLRTMVQAVNGQNNSLG